MTVPCTIKQEISLITQAKEKSVDLNLVFIILISALFSLGGITFIAGIVILAISAGNQAVTNLSTQVSNLAQKGIAEDIAGLVGNAANFINGLDHLTKTRAGIGVFLTILGLLMMVGACIFALKFQPFL